jgi:hypothetical protein
MKKTFTHSLLTSTSLHADVKKNSILSFTKILAAFSLITLLGFLPNQLIAQAPTLSYYPNVTITAGENVSVSPIDTDGDGIPNN